jgi:hypothetical protein
LSECTRAHRKARTELGASAMVWCDLISDETEMMRARKFSAGATRVSDPSRRGLLPADLQPDRGGVPKLYTNRSDGFMGIGDEPARSRCGGPVAATPAVRRALSLFGLPFPRPRRTTNILLIMKFLMALLIAPGLLVRGA